MTTNSQPEPEPLPVPVTVLVPTFNRAHFLGEALESILNQSAPPAQVVVIDDGSEDGTAAVVQAFGGRVEYLRQENSGKSAALNRGLAHAREDLIWIFDDDDIAAPRALESLFEALENCPEAGFAYARCDKFYGEWPASERIANYAYEAENRHALYVKLMEDFFLWQGAMLVKRACYDTVGPFDSRLARSQDYEMALRLARRFDGVGVPMIAFHQRHHEGVRGPRKARVAAGGVEAAWRRYNHVIFRDLYETHSLEEFVVPTGEALPADRTRMVALMQRGSIMARKGIWDLAAADFRAAAELAGSHGYETLHPQEAAALTKVFQPGARSIFESGAEAATFSRAVEAFARPLCLAVTANLLFPVTYRLRRVHQHPDKLFEGRQLWRILSRLFRVGCLPPLMQARRKRLELFKVSELGVEPAN